MNNDNQNNKDKAQANEIKQPQQSQGLQGQKNPPVNPIPAETQPVTASKGTESEKESNNKDKGSCA